MSVGFCAVQWNRRKLIYDAILIACVVLFIGTFNAIAYQWHPPQNISDKFDIHIRSFGTCAFLMLTIVLSIGPLARLDRRFLPLLYNRRHFGVLTFIVAAMHVYFMVRWYGDGLPNFFKDLLKWQDYAAFIGFPFKPLGIVPLFILFVLAATSHDFWLGFLSPRVWKALHMALYVAYAFVLMHVGLGIMQYEYTLLVPVMVFGSFGLVTTLHLLAGWRERAGDHGHALTPDGWIRVGAPQDIPDKGARIVAAPGGERIAVFRDGAQIGALSNLCAHQNGPLGEGSIIDGCVTCPWHGYQYRLADGCAPPPFTEKLATYRVRLREGLVEVHPDALAPGTPAAITNS
jgi:nitrite reductase/ring-hydroxylating ferredoxin subunit/DMSO/TMAO reductase YedYZ heme-binding membrane subunit